MPYKMRKLPNKDLYKVVNTETGKVHSSHSTKDNAKAQLRILEGLLEGGKKELDEKDIFKLLTITGRYKLIGSATAPHLLYTSDFDLQEYFSRTNVGKYPDKILELFREKYKKALANPDIYIIDFKCGEYEREPIRWDKKTIADGYQMVGKKKKITFQQCILQKSTIKMDIIAFIDDVATEFSENYYFQLNGFTSFCNFSKEEILYSIKGDILDFANEGNLFKAFKRVFAFIRIRDKREDKQLIKFFNSQTGLINSIKNELEIVKTVLETDFKPVSKERITKNLTLIQDQLLNVREEKLRDKAIEEIEEIKGVSQDKQVGRIHEITVYLQRSIARDTRAFLKDNERFQHYFI